jgi:pimeloyl-ACP methyl ester carboxylesterase
MPKHYFDFKEARTAYWSYHDTSLPTIVMIHGFRGTHHGLERIVEQLSEYNVIVPDLPGFGASHALPNNTHDLEHYVEFTHAFIKHICPKTPPVLLGHSFGSIIAGHYAAKYPQTITKLILVNPIGAPALKGPKAAMTQLAIFYYWLGRILPGRASHLWLSAKSIVKIMSVSMTKTKDPAVRRFIHQQHLTHFSTFASPRVVAEAFRTSVSHDVREVAHAITLPTLLIAGEHDDITALPKQRLLATAIKDARLVVIPRVGHLIHYETAPEAAKAIKAFLT